MNEFTFSERPSNPSFVDLTGNKFNHLTVIGYAGRVGKHQYWICRCDCGNTSRTNTSKLRAGRSKSCGCMVAKWASQRFTTHGHTKGKDKRIYGIWKSMLRRCCNPLDVSYPYYGGRGISVCDRWHDFENFLLDMGYPLDGLSIDRIDNNGNYEPSNCRWADAVTQGNNKRNSAVVSHCGQEMTVSEWAREYGLPPGLVFARLSRGWSIKDALLPAEFSKRPLLTNSPRKKGKGLLRGQGSGVRGAGGQAEG